MMTDVQSHNIEDQLRLAANWIREADAVLICAGAGMSNNDGFNVYVSKEDFAQAYPWFPRWGYTTAYECMGLFGDRSIPLEAKWGFWLNHFNNMRFVFPVPSQYREVWEMVQGKDHFVYTSNVDGNFERAGFAAENIYTPQGDYAFYQCMRKCRPDAVFESKPLLDSLRPMVDERGMLPLASIPKCKYCGGDVFGNVRGGNWFIHQKYDVANRNFVDWIEAKLASRCKLVVLEVGAGFNTPTVTPFPMEAIVRELSHNSASLVRVNPTEPGVPEDLPRALGINMGCNALHDIHSYMAHDSVKTMDPNSEEQIVSTGRISNKHFRRQAGPKDFPWRAMMENLRQ